MSRRMCRFPGCENFSMGGGTLCSGHAAQRVRGKELSPLRPYKKRNLSVAETIAYWIKHRLVLRQHPDMPTLCWIWTGTRVTGYGRASGIGGKSGQGAMVHRLMWAFLRGPIPEGMMVCHVKDHDKACCRPSHLYLGDRSQNRADWERYKRKRSAA